MNRILTQSTFQQTTKQDGFEKGQRFEKFIIELFNRHYFYLKKWRKAEAFGNSNLVIDPWNPDIEMELVFTGLNKYRFAVECKWRSIFKDGKIDWAEDHQICAYR